MDSVAQNHEPEQGATPHVHGTGDMDECSTCRLTEPLNPIYQRGFVSGAQAVVDLAYEIDMDRPGQLADAARRRGYIS